MEGAFDIWLPNQNQLYALYLSRCCDLHIRKPNKYIIQLLQEDAYSRKIRIQRDASTRQVPLKVFQEGIYEDVKGDVPDCLTEDNNKLAASFDDYCVDGNLTHYDGSCAVTPFSLLKSIPNFDRVGCLGTKGLLAFLSLVEESPLLEEIDFTGIPNFFQTDIYAKHEVLQIPSGNDVMRELCRIAMNHPSLRLINFGSQPLGTECGILLLEAMRNNSNLTDISWNSDGIESSVNRELIKMMARNQSGPNRMPPQLPTAHSPRIRLLNFIDRKTSEQRQQLSNLLAFAFSRRSSSIQTPSMVADREGPQQGPAFEFLKIQHDNWLYDTQNEHSLLLHATAMSLHEMVLKVPRCLRGDGEHLFVICDGVVEVLFSGTGSSRIELGRGDFFGEPLNSTLFGAGTMSVLERGTVFAIPLQLVKNATTRWASNVDQYYCDFMQKVPILQSLPTWTRVRMCEMATSLVFDNNEEKDEETIVVKANDAFAGLYIVQEGSFTLVTGNKDQTLNGRKAPSEVFSLLSMFDVFGFDAVFTANNHHRVTVVTGCRSSKSAMETSDGGEIGNPEGNTRNKCIHIHPNVSSRHVIKSLKSVLKMLFREQK
eukprot:Tbor_TRINITY_DN416_c0_g1::TRINITY_DN416_c0_g1_i1::g.3218::m.3218